MIKARHLPPPVSGFTVKLLCINFVLQLFIVAGHSVGFLGMASGLPQGSFSTHILDWGNNWYLLQGGAVCFFIISAYLFFRGYEKPGAYRAKLKRRIFSLALPFLLWNILLFTWGFSFKSLVFTFSGYPTDFYPANGPTWFLRELMLMMLAAPAIWWIVKRRLTAALWLSCVVAGWIYFEYIHFTGLANVFEAMLGFTLGAYILRHDVKLFDFNPRMLASCLIGLAAIYIVSYIFPEHNVLLGRLRYFAKFGIYISLGIMLAHSRIASAVAYLGEASFFIFVAHMPVLQRVGPAVFNAANPHTDLAAITCLIAVWALTISICVGAWWLLKLIAPRALNVLTGGRLTRTIQREQARKNS